MRVQSKRYRGRMLVYLNDRGSLNLINELPVEDYLRGVVPSEMGPELVQPARGAQGPGGGGPHLHPAQPGRVRPRGVRHLRHPALPGLRRHGRSSTRSPTARSPRPPARCCSTRASWSNALYSSTCGGHTEDVHVIFPLKQEPYLKGVPCMEAGVARIDGDLAAGRPLPGRASPAGCCRRPRDGRRSSPWRPAWSTWPSSPACPRRASGSPASTAARCSASSPPPSTWPSTPASSWRREDVNYLLTIRRPTGARRTAGAPPT